MPIRIVTSVMKAQFRMDEDKMKFRVEDLDDKERDYLVVSKTRAMADRRSHQLPERVLSVLPA